MTVLITIVDIGTTMVVIVLASTLNSIVEALALNIAKLLWWRIPPTVLSVCCLWGFVGLGDHKT
jgi:hypothetical protein